MNASTRRSPSRKHSDNDDNHERTHNEYAPTHFFQGAFVFARKLFFSSANTFFYFTLIH